MTLQGACGLLICGVLLVLVGTNFAHCYVPLPLFRPGYGGRNPYGQSFDVTYQQQLLRPGEEITYWENVTPFKKQGLMPTSFQAPSLQSLPPMQQPSSEVWFPEGTQVVGDPNPGFLSSIIRYIISFLQNLVPAPIRFLFGWY
ncbi:hypothetical protein MTP99_014737 [Tenebrio molitor]|nr:hypothetical protein MTP99_014737 [Tenebrio molitor]CAH1373321.1 unnamed protein product [Tenebrio molitor]